MTRPLTVHSLVPLDLANISAIASLPAHLRFNDNGPADIVIVGPDEKSIIQARKLQARGLVILRPSQLAANSVKELDAAGCALFPVLPLTASILDLDNVDTLAGAGIVRSHLAWAGLQIEGMTEHLSALQALLGPMRDFQLMDSGAESYSGTATSEGDVPVFWSGKSVAARPEVELDIVGTTSRIEIRGIMDGAARPLEFSRATVDGVCQSMGSFETGHRKFWRHIVSALETVDPNAQWRSFCSLHKTAQSLARLG